MNPRSSLTALLLALLLPGVAAAQVFVIPRQAGKTPINTFDLAWRHVDILVGPDAEGLAKPPEHTAHDQPGAPQDVSTAAAPIATKSGDATSTPMAPPADSKPIPSANIPVDTTDAGPLPQEIAAASADGGVPYADGGVVAQAGGDGGTSVVSGPLLLGDSDAGFNYTYAKTLGAKTGGVRFYFYEREREVAERAVPVIEEAYRYLVGRFKYVPTQTFPYILYNSYAEFLQTNVFPVSEGTLGVTSTEDLKLTLPYLGDHRLFEEISSHELTHQFTIQKVRTVAEQAKVFGDPLSNMPLWFVEGLAEFYAKRGLDPETEMLVRDLLVNPDLMRGYAFLDFFSPGPYGYLWIYKVGQTRVAFLEDEYGDGISQRILEESPRLVGGSRDSPSLKFEELLERLTGDDPKRLAARFENWLKRRAFKTYLGSEQSAPALDSLSDLPGIVTAMASGPDGYVLAVRTIIPETGESRLYLLDPRMPEKTVEVAADGQPGIESLHPVSGRNFALGKDKLAFVAEVTGRDVLYVQDFGHSAEKHATDVLVRRSAIRTGIDRDPGLAVKLETGGRRAIRVDKQGVVAVYSPAFSPDERYVAFIGIDDKGLRDVYMVDLAAGDNAAPRKLTDDVFAERQLTWGPTGIIYTSDATSHRKYNLFRIKPDAPGPAERLTSEDRDEADPVALPDGRIFFVAYTHSSSDLHERLPDGRLVRRTDLTTGVFEPGPGPEGSLWMLFHLSGERRPSLLRPPRMLALEEEKEPPAEPPGPLAIRPLTDAQQYRPFARQNLEFGPIFGFAGAGGGGFVGQVFASATDRLRNHQMILTLAVYGSFELTDGLLLYVNDEKRATWGGGLFQSLRFRVDQTFKDVNKDLFFTSAERYFGVLGSYRYPLSTFLYIQGDLSLGGTKYFLDDPVEFYLAFPERNEANQALLGEWRAKNQAIRFQTELSGRLGYDSIKYHYATGPLSGSSVLMEATVGVQPFNDEAYSNVRLDAERYFPIYGRTNVFARLGTGTTLGGRYARSYYLSSFDTLRGVNFGDERWLLGRHFVYSTVEMQLPLNDIIRVAFLSDLEAIVAMDTGGVGDGAKDLWDHRVLNAVVGFNVSLGPLLLRLHFARPFDIKAAAGKPDPGWVTNFSLGIAGLNGFFDQRDTGRQAPPPNRAALPALGGGYLTPGVP
ncbi:tolB protein precursor protein [Corallococcus sp. H22C18031201]|uniref:M61 family metallopeptidase n=1 Tax=Citreicoccus inhibens TaxID=2849499 RepID=UPI000E748F8E|nr:tolB protein precursor protein [Citreicoccus inhibens]MBU8895020.1 tolB protein precursor protein [Citreicoccus inhibens]RJS27177.1 tolB protein precursor protein [Corallococcus sp. H22C18031201]